MIFKRSRTVIAVFSRPIHPLFLAATFMINSAITWHLPIVFALNVGLCIFSLHYYFLVLRKVVKLMHDSDDKVPPMSTGKSVSSTRFVDTLKR